VRGHIDAAEQGDDKSANVILGAVNARLKVNGLSPSGNAGTEAPFINMALPPAELKVKMLALLKEAIESDKDFRADVQKLLKEPTDQDSE
jgi:hypothetical protein